MLTNSSHTYPFITGSSVHNQRIERLWRDTYRCVLSLYYQLFYFLEDANKLDPDSDVDLYCLHYVYMKKINSALSLFSDGWNSHAMTSEHGMTPIQIFTAATLLQGRNLLSPPVSESVLGELDPPSVTVPRTESPLNRDNVAELERLVDTMDDDGESDYSINVYIRVREYVHSQLGT